MESRVAELLVRTSTFRHYLYNASRARCCSFCFLFSSHSNIFRFSSSDLPAVMGFLYSDCLARSISWLENPLNMPDPKKTTTSSGRAGRIISRHMVTSSSGNTSCPLNVYLLTKTKNLLFQIEKAGSSRRAQTRTVITASVTPLPVLGRWLCVIRFPGFCLFGDLYFFLQYLVFRLDKKLISVNVRHTCKITGCLSAFRACSGLPTDTCHSLDKPSAR